MLGLSHADLIEFGKRADVGGPPVSLGGGVYLFPCGVSYASGVWQAPTYPEDQQAARLRYWKTVEEVVSKDLKQLQAALNPLSAGVGWVPSFSWPTQGIWVAHYGLPPGRNTPDGWEPDNERAVQRLQDILANAKANIQQLESASPQRLTGATA